MSYEGGKWLVTASAAWSEVENLAALDETEDGVPVLTQLDVVAGYTINENWTINASIENFIYDDAFKSSYGIAPIEERIGLELLWTTDEIEFNVSTTWFGSRDLNDYGYEGFDILGDPTSLKTLNADNFYVINFKTKYNLSDSVAIYIGASNLTDETQVGDGESPLFYDADGGFDVAYIYGALHGREFYAGFEIKL